MASRSTLVIGIDFGTTFSGVSWAFCKKNSAPRQPEVITRWPTVFTRNSDRQKVPSKIHYDQTGKITWGYNISPKVEPIQWFKLLLLEAADMPASLRRSAHIKKARRMLDDLNKDAVVVVGDYLGELWKHAIENIENAKGKSLVNGTLIHVVLTVPAIWKDYARNKMRKAAVMAGILNDRLCGETQLSFISEPEAAVLATLPDIDNRDDLVAGDSFIVCDCGGGTVDIISYTVDRPEPIEVKECVEGAGALCGATFLDEDFEEFLRTAVGSTTWNNMDREDIKKLMNNEWEHGIKSEFIGSELSCIVDVPKRNKRMNVTLNGKDLRKVFEGVVSEIHELVTSQISAVKQKTKQPPKFVILVGGFGRCPFTFHYLRQHNGDEVEILQASGELPWSAICRGAATSGSAGLGKNVGMVQLRSRIARLSYGWPFDTKFQKWKHDKADQKWCNTTGRYVAKNQMQWVLKRGQEVDTEQPKTFSYFFPFEAGEVGVDDCHFTAYTCESANPPARLERGVNRLVSLDFLTPCPVEALPKRRDSGPEYHALDIEVRMEISGASLEITISSNGKRLSQQNLNISCD